MAAPAIVAQCLERWELTPETPFERSLVSIAMPVTRGDRSEAVLKVQFPHWESDEEALALEMWDGNGAIRLLDHAEDLHALLLERCHPGEPLSNQEPTYALDVITTLLERTWLSEPEGIRSLDNETSLWVANLRDQMSRDSLPYDRRLAELAVETLIDLAASQHDCVLLHQDLHGDNVLSAEREPWLIIDPKPLSGEKAFGLAPVISSYEFGHSRAAVRWRIDKLVESLGVDRARSVGWAFSRTVAWSMDGPVLGQRHVETAKWLAELL